MRRTGQISLLMVCVLLFSINTTYSQGGESIDVLVIHSGNGEFATITSLLNDQPIINLDSILISELESTDISSYRFIIFASDVEFETDTVAESKLSSHLTGEGKAFLTFSPYIEEFEDGLTQSLGILNPDKIYPSDISSPTWTLNTLVSLGDLSIGNNFDYTGSILTFDKTVSAQSLVEVTSGINLGDDDDEIEYPFPVIVNASSSSNLIITSTLSISSGNTLRLYGTGNLFESLIEEIVSMAISSYQVLNTIDVQPTGNNGDPSQGIQIPEIISPEILVFVIIAVLLLFVGKILGFFRWVGEKLIYVGIGVIGIFYNVQDRVLDDNDVLMNQQRSDIMKYLDHVEASGAHLREIKTIMQSGTGSLLWHLQVLEDFNWITKVKVDKYTVFVSYNFMDQFDPNLKLIELQLQSKVTQDILETLLEEPNHLFDINYLVEKTDIYRKAVRRFITKLDSLSLIEIVNDNPISFRIINAEALRSVLKVIELRESFSFEVDSDVNISRMEN